MKINDRLRLRGAFVILLASPYAEAKELVLYESEHIRFVEVSNQPGELVNWAAEKYPAVLAVDTSLPKAAEIRSDKTEAGSKFFGNRVTPSASRTYPWCQIESAQPPQEIRFTGEFPAHYYRIEYKRVDGDDYAANWKRWYPWIAKPGKKATNPSHRTQAARIYSKEYPFSKAYDPTVAAPANHFVRYENEHVQLVEVVIRPGETENFHGHPYSSVFADDGGGFYPAIGLHNKVLNPNSKNPRGDAGVPPNQARYPTCYAAVPEWPHSVTVTGTVPQHFYRLHFKTIAGALQSDAPREP